MTESTLRRCGSEHLNGRPACAPAVGPSKEAAYLRSPSGWVSFYGGLPIQWFIDIGERLELNSFRPVSPIDHAECAERPRFVDAKRGARGAARRSG